MCPARSYVVCQRQEFLCVDRPLLSKVVDLLCVCLQDATLQEAALEAFLEVAMTCAQELATRQARCGCPCLAPCASAACRGYCHASTLGSAT